MSEHKRTEISELGEFGLIELLTKDFQISKPTTIKGIGDDAAVIEAGSEAIVLSSDTLIENVHFDLTYAPLKHVGYKAVVVNLSDVYAMNALPEQILVSIAISNRFSVEALQELYTGMRLACEAYGVDLIGGDTTTSLKGLMLSITAVGRNAADKITYRNTAQVNDVICVTGQLGGAYLGLQLLEREKQVYLANPEMQPSFDGKDYLVERILKPEARKDIIELFERKNIQPSAMIDISDGLSSELLHIAKQSNVGITIYDEKVPIHEQAFNQAVEFEIDPLNCALSGGDEYELLFTLSVEEFEQIKDEADITSIGAVTTANSGNRLITKGGAEHELTALGWRHF